MTAPTPSEARAVLSWLRRAAADGRLCCILPHDVRFARVVRVGDLPGHGAPEAVELVLDADGSLAGDPRASHELVVLLPATNSQVHVPLTPLDVTPEGQVVRAEIAQGEARYLPFPNDGMRIGGPVDAILWDGTDEAPTRAPVLCERIQGLGSFYPVLTLRVPTGAAPASWQDRLLDVGREGGRSGTDRYRLSDPIEVEPVPDGVRVSLHARPVSETDPDAFMEANAHVEAGAEAPTPSAVEVPVGAHLRLRLFGYPGSVEVHVFQATTQGFLAGLPLPVVDAPWGAETEDGIRFRCRPAQGYLRFDLWSADLGERTRWYNRLLRLTGLTDVLRPEDADDMAGLLADTGHHPPALIRDRRARGPLMRWAWALEEALPRTRMRLVRRMGDGRLGGHALLVRISDSMWAAVDNVRAGAYPGRWNRDAIAPWLRAMAEMIAAHPEAVVQWTFLSASGVWGRFDQEIVARHPGWYVTPVLSTPSPSEEPSSWARLSPKKARDLLADPPSQALPVFDALDHGRLEGAFARDVEWDYGCPPERYLYRAEVEGALFLVDFAVSPAWVGLNGGHDFAYVYPLSDAELSQSGRQTLLADLAEHRLAAGSPLLPTRVFVVGERPALGPGAKAVNLVLRPEALRLAADLADGTLP